MNRLSKFRCWRVELNLVLYCHHCFFSSSLLNSVPKTSAENLDLKIRVDHHITSQLKVHLYSVFLLTVYHYDVQARSHIIQQVTHNALKTTATAQRQNELLHKTKPLFSCFGWDHIKYTHFALKADLRSDHACSSALETKSEMVGRAGPGEATLFWLGCLCRWRDGYYKLWKWCNVGEMSLLLWFTCLEFLDYLLKIINSWKKKERDRWIGMVLFRSGKPNLMKRARADVIGGN